MTFSRPRVGLLLVLLVLLQSSSFLVSAQKHGANHLALHRKRSTEHKAFTTNGVVKKQVSTPKLYSKSTPASSQGSFKNDSLLGIKPNSTQINGVYIGFVIEATGVTMGQINKALDRKAACYGRYAQVNDKETFNGRDQLLSVFEDVKASGAVFQPAIMVRDTSHGFTKEDNHQAVAVAKVLCNFTDAGISVWARLNHEANWYARDRDRTYLGNPDDFKKAWAVFSDALKVHAPKVKRFWTPNVDTSKAYQDWAPYDMDTVDLVGVDYYPKSKEEATLQSFLDRMKPFYTQYATDNRMFALGETGLHYDAPYTERLAWLETITKAKGEMERFLSVTWYNCEKEWDYKLVGPGLNTYALREKLS